MIAMLFLGCLLEAYYSVPRNPVLITKTPIFAVGPKLVVNVGYSRVRFA